ncbi:MAG: alpha-N-arabinofuranosidase [Lachnospiraceae bacterium]
MSEKKVTMLVNAKDVIGHIHPEIYGHFSEHLGRCIYGGIFVGEHSEIPNVGGIRKDIIDAFRNIKLPVLRWPGGCFADEYHWKDGIGPKSQRKEIVNTNWGGVTEDNSFGTHEFLKLCELVGCEPYINANVGSGTVQEMSEWVEYITSAASSPMTKLRAENGRKEPWRLKYLGVGNENWGCGGNMRPEKYVDEYRRYQTYCKNHSGNSLYKIACGPNASDFEWMESLMKNLNPGMVKGIDLHYYTVYDWEKRGHATEFDEEAYYHTLKSANYLDTLLTRHTEIMNRYDPNNEIGLVVGEWGCWYEVEPGTNPGFLYQQNTMRDAIVAGMELNTFNRHSKRVVMANLAQTVNVLQSLILTEGEKMVKTPTYHVFDLFKGHQGGDAVYCYVDQFDSYENVPHVSSSASVKDGKLTITLANTSLTDAVSLESDIVGVTFSKASARILTNEVHACNDFEHPERVAIQDMAVETDGSRIGLTVPPCAVVCITLE